MSETVLDETIPETEPEGEPDGDETEIEPDGDETEIEDEPEAEAPPEPMDDRDIEKLTKKLDAEATRHSNRLSELLGESAQGLEPCPFCDESLRGFYFPEQIADDPARVSFVQQQAGGAVEMKQEEGIEVCEVCNGYGHTLTGSKVPETAMKLCGCCSGNGYTDLGARNSWRNSTLTRVEPEQQQAVVVTPPPAAAFMPTNDRWGRPQGTPYYGIDPDYMTPEQKAQDAFGPRS